jgi:hypothetical protein
MGMVVRARDDGLPFRAGDGFSIERVTSMPLTAMFRRRVSWLIAAVVVTLASTAGCGAPGGSGEARRAAAGQSGQTVATGNVADDADVDEDDAMLDAYNQMLSRMNGQRTPITPDE